MSHDDAEAASFDALQARNAFCAIRPPGHHAGPLGTVTSANDPHGSQGFCFFNNIVVAAAYAVNVYRHQGMPLGQEFARWGKLGEIPSLLGHS